MHLPTKLLVATLLTAALGLVVASTTIAIPLLADLPTVTPLVPVKPHPLANALTLVTPLPLHAAAPGYTVQLLPITFNATVQPIPTQ